MVEIEIPSKEELYQQFKISDLSTLNEVLKKPVVANKMLAITCFAMVLEAFGLFFIAVQTSFAYMIYALDPKYVTLLIYFTQWSDGGGIFAGRAFGKNSFFKTVSPNKTREGIYGALTLPLFVAFLFWIVGTLSDGYLAVKMSLLSYLALSGCCAVCAVLGDLLESFLKRCSDVKDSGWLLRDHGGVLDRLDSLLFAAPFMFWFAMNHSQIKEKDNIFDYVNLSLFFK